jgi:hypothetical protein
LRSRRQRSRGPRALALALLVAGTAAEELPASRAAAGELVAVVNAANPVREISLQRLRLIYGGYKKTWRGGAPIHLVLPAAGSPVMERVASDVFRRRGEAEVSRYYLDLVYRQKIAREPPKLPAAESVALVRGDPEAIAIVDRDELGDTHGVRVIRIEGL